MTGYEKYRYLIWKNLRWNVSFRHFRLLLRIIRSLFHALPAFSYNSLFLIKRERLSGLSPICRDTYSKVLYDWIHNNQKECRQFLTLRKLCVHFQSYKLGQLLISNWKLYASFWKIQWYYIINITSLGLFSCGYTVNRSFAHSGKTYRIKPKKYLLQAHGAIVGIARIIDKKEPLYVAGWNYFVEKWLALIFLGALKQTMRNLWLVKPFVSSYFDYFLKP